MRNGNARSERRWYLSTLTFKLWKPAIKRACGDRTSSLGWRDRVWCEWRIRQEPTGQTSYKSQVIESADGSADSKYLGSRISRRHLEVVSAGWQRGRSRDCTDNWLMNPWCACPEISRRRFLRKIFRSFLETLQVRTANCEPSLSARRDR